MFYEAPGVGAVLGAIFDVLDPALVCQLAAQGTSFRFIGVSKAKDFEDWAKMVAFPMSLGAPKKQLEPQPAVKSKSVKHFARTINSAGPRELGGSNTINGISKSSESSMKRAAIN